MKSTSTVPEDADPPLFMNPTDSNRVYTDIMALGYNGGSIQKAVDDIYEMQSVLHGESSRLLEEIVNRVNLTAFKYPILVRAFTVFHEGRKKGIAPDTLESQVGEVLRRG